MKLSKTSKTFGLLFILLTLAMILYSGYDQNSTELNSNGSDVDSAKVVTEATTTQAMMVYKSPTCGCCSKWVDHLNHAGFHTLVENQENLNEIKSQFNIEPQHRSCHTASYGNFVFEGHIPAKLIQQFLNNPPKGATGLAVPAMPLGSPGMEVGDRFTPYKIIQLNNNGQHTFFAEVTNIDDQY